MSYQGTEAPVNVKRHGEKGQASTRLVAWPPALTRLTLATEEGCAP